MYVSSDGTGDEASWTLVASGTLPDIRGMYCDEQPEPLVIKFDTVRGKMIKFEHVCGKDLRKYNLILQNLKAF